MKTFKTLTVLASALFIYSCKPKPLSIQVVQSAPVITLSSATPDNHTVLISAGYSTNSLMKLVDTGSGSIKIPKEMLLQDGLITITKTGGATDTLHFISDGLYGNADIDLEHLATYTINVYEQGKGHIATATTVYHSMPAVRYDQPRLNKIKGDTTVEVNVKIDNVQIDDYFFVSYNTAANARKQSFTTPELDVSALAAFTPKQLTLISGQDERSGNVERKISMRVSPGDTLMIQTAKIDKAYYDYLTAYKKSGALINQLTGEPINMPTNIVKGFGFFSLFAADRKVFYLEKN